MISIVLHFGKSRKKKKVKKERKIKKSPGSILIKFMLYSELLGFELALTLLVNVSNGSVKMISF